ncbi:MAG: imidazole glycerol phosphate synthase subunit HisH [Phycisphaerales bacterium]|nr:imidazole glycerol phosphate synthase subunit HisH [Phycisphaerales bacterium]
MTNEVVILRTGVANIASVQSAFARLGVAVRLCDEPSDIVSAAFVVLPGVGAFGSAMQYLQTRAMIDPLSLRVRLDRPTLAICLGLQLLCAASDESPGRNGIGIIHETVHRFHPRVRVPQIGWNKVRPLDGAGFITEGYAYFANSYCLRQAPDGWLASRTDYGEPFVSALQRGRVLACQFHPELSGTWGLNVLSRWLAGEDGAPGC